MDGWPNEGSRRGPDVPGGCPAELVCGYVCGPGEAIRSGADDGFSRFGGFGSSGSEFSRDRTLDLFGSAEGTAGTAGL